jgi:hypothetical protein
LGVHLELVSLELLGQPKVLELYILNRFPRILLEDDDDHTDDVVVVDDDDDGDGDDDDDADDNDDVRYV